MDSWNQWINFELENLYANKRKTQHSFRKKFFFQGIAKELNYEMLGISKMLSDRKMVANSFYPKWLIGVENRWSVHLKTDNRTDQDKIEEQKKH